MRLTELWLPQNLSFHFLLLRTCVVMGKFPYAALAHHQGWYSVSLTQAPVGLGGVHFVPKCYAMSLLYVQLSFISLPCQSTVTTNCSSFRRKSTVFPLTGHRQQLFSKPLTIYHLNFDPPGFPGLIITSISHVDCLCQVLHSLMKPSHNFGR